MSSTPRVLRVEIMGLLLLAACGCVNTPDSVMFAVGEGKDIIVSQPGNGTQVFASYQFGDKATAPCRIQWLPYGSIAADSYRLFLVPELQIALLLENRQYFNSLPDDPTLSGWSELVLKECLLFIVDLKVNSAICMPTDGDAINTASLLSGREDQLAQWVTRIDLHRTLDTDSLAKLSLLPNLETLVLGRQRITIEGASGLDLLPSLRVLNIANALTDDETFAMLQRQSQLKIMLVNAEQASKIVANARDSGLPFELKIVNFD